MAAAVVDAHQHFWDLAGEYDYPWLAGDFLPIRRAFEPADLRPSLEGFGISGTVLVQTQNGLNETRAFLELADRTDFITGVVGWVDLTDPHVGELLSELRACEHGRRLVGVRHLLHEEADPAWLLQDDVRRGLAAVADAGMVYDLVGKTVHLPAMVRTVADFPRLRFVLDHIAKPEIKARVTEPWTSLIAQFAPHRDHVWCKLSGMITEADWSGWTIDDLRPYVAHALDVFGTDRCMYGSDWPVCLVAGSYDRVIGALRACLAERTDDEREQIFGRSAIEAYHLSDVFEVVDGAVKMVSDKPLA
jgi:L-fuconolactonase